MSQKKLLASFDNNIEVTVNAMIYCIHRMYIKFLQKNMRQLIAGLQMKYRFGNILLEIFRVCPPNITKLQKTKKEKNSQI